MSPGARIARRLWDATAKGDGDAVRELLHPDVVWRACSAGDLSGEFRGHDPVIGLLARSGELVDRLQSQLIDVFGSDDDAVLHYRLSASRDSRRLSTEILLLMHTRDGRIVDVTTAPVDAAANDLFWRSH